MANVIVTKKSEKVLLWMHRNKISGSQIAHEAGITRQAYSQMLINNTFSDKVILAITRLGYVD